MGSAAYEQLLAVQELDVHLTQLRHRLANHPLRAEQAQLALEQTNGEGQRDEIEGRRHELDRNLRRLGDEVATIEAKRAKVEGRLYDGTVTATKELLALQDEGANLLERQRRIEDDELELMESLETVGAEADQAVATLADTERRVVANAEALTAAIADIEAGIAQTTAARREAAAPIGPELLATYESLLAEFDGAPLARYVGGRCDGCHMQLSAMAVDRLAKAPPDEVVTCEECGRLLVR